MTLVLTEGFDHMSSPASFLPAKGWSIVDTGSFSGEHCTSSFSTGRIGGFALSLTAATTRTFDSSYSVTKALPSTYAHPCKGFAFKFGTLPAGDLEVFQLQTVANARVMGFVVKTTGKFDILNAAGTVIATSATTLSAGSWYYIEFDLTVGTSGSVTVHLNGGAEIAATTANFSTTNVGAIRYQISTFAAGVSTGWSFDDVYVLNTGSSPNNALLGDVAIETLYPSAAGAHTQWTPDSGNNYARVNEHTSGTYPDGDTSYVADKVVNDRDSYVMSDLALLTGTIYGVQTFMYARKDNAGTRQIAPVLRPVATDRDGTTVTLGTSYTFYTEIRETNPDTSAAWTTSDINATEIGVKMVA